MSVIVSNPDQIHNHPVNTSSAKQLYTFTREVRFKPTKKGICAQTSYPLPTTKSRRKAAFGYGNKYDFTKNAPKNPPPNNYKINSLFKINKTKSKGKTFGLSRESMSATGQRVITKGYPGPGQYNRHSTLDKLSYSMRKKTLNPYSYTSARKVPGPGQYSILPGISKTGRYPISKYRNSLTRLINPASSTRFAGKQKPRAPGPGIYSHKKQSMSKTGDYFYSKFHNSGVRTFGQQVRNTWGIKATGGTPGPGYYRIPSDFGYYESKNVRRFAKTSYGKSRSRRNSRASLPNPLAKSKKTKKPQPLQPVENQEVKAPEPEPVKEAEQKAPEPIA